MTRNNIYNKDLILVTFLMILMGNVLRAEEALFIKDVNDKGLFYLTNDHAFVKDKPNVALLLDAKKNPAKLEEGGGSVFILVKDASGNRVPPDDGKKITLKGDDNFELKIEVEDDLSIGKLEISVEEDGGINVIKFLNDDLNEVQIPRPDWAKKIEILSKSLPENDSSNSPDSSDENSNQKDSKSSVKDDLKRFLNDSLGLSNATDGREIASSIKSSLESADLSNPVVNRLFSGKDNWRFLKGLSIEPVVLQPEKQDPIFGMRYSLKKQYDPADMISKNKDLMVMFDLDINGLIAAEEGENPEDFQSGKLSLFAFQTLGGDISEDYEPDETTHKNFNIYTLKLAEFTDPDELLISPEREAFFQLVRDNLTPQFYWDLAVNAGYEADQRFKTSQFAVGVSAQFELKAWSRHSAWSALNLLDYPFAFARLLFGYDKDWSPRGASWPTIRFGFDRVTPTDGDPRENFGETDDFWRTNTEISFSTPLASIGGELYTLNMNWRFHRELDARRSIRNANLHQYSYFTLAVRSSAGLVLSYAKGRLPFDRKDDEVYGVGYQLNF